MSRIYKNCMEAVDEIERDIMEMGIVVHPHSMQNKDVSADSNFSTLEVQNYSFTILDTVDMDEMAFDCLEWCKAEFEERISHEDINPGVAWKLRPEVWEEFLNPEGKFCYTYNDRLNCHLQVDKIIAELKKNPDSRQAIIHVHFPIDLFSLGGLKRMPCSMYYQLMVRRGKLDVIYNMRSSDYDTHFKNDIWQACALRNHIAKALEIPPGLFHMNIGSLHRYKNYTAKHVF